MSASIEIPATFELLYPGDVELVPVVRRFIFDLCNKAIPGSPEIASRVALAASELLDNASRHGARRDAVLRFEILGLEATPLVRVSVSNSLTLGQLQGLSLEVEKVRLAADPMAYYRELQRLTATQKVGLGLARIRAEAGLDVHLGVHGSKATVFAQSPELLSGPAPRPPSRPSLLSSDPARPISHGTLEAARPPSHGGLDAARPASHAGLESTRPPTLGGLAPVRPAAAGPKSEPPLVQPAGPGSAKK